MAQPLVSGDDSSCAERCWRGKRGSAARPRAPGPCSTDELPGRANRVIIGH